MEEALVRAQPLQRKVFGGTAHNHQKHKKLDGCARPRFRALLDRPRVLILSCDLAAREHQGYDEFKFVCLMIPGGGLQERGPVVGDLFRRHL